MFTYVSMEFKDADTVRLVFEFPMEKSKRILELVEQISKQMEKEKEDGECGTKTQEE